MRYKENKGNNEGGVGEDEEISGQAERQLEKAGRQDSGADPVAEDEVVNV